MSAFTLDTHHVGECMFRFANSYQCIVHDSFWHPDKERCEGYGKASTFEQVRDALGRASAEGRNILPDATDDQAATIEQWAGDLRATLDAVTAQIEHRATRR